MSAAVDDPIPLSEPDLGGAERRLVDECLDSGWVSSVGPFVERFEQAFAERFGAAHAVACASGTAAIQLALHAVGVAPGDVVLCSDSTFIASANPARHLGAELRFVDSEAASWNMDPERLREALADCAATGRRVAAVIVVHVLGCLAELGPIAAICAEYDVPLIEDAAEGLGGRYVDDHPDPALRGREAGTVGRLGCYSFNGNKLMTCGGGGMVVSADPALAARVRHLSTQAKEPGLAYVHSDAAYNFRLTNLAAALGLAQLARCDDFLTRRRAVHRAYRERLADLPLTWQTDAAHSLGGRWLSAALIDARDAVVAALHDGGVLARPVWLPVSAQPCYRGSRRYGGAVADAIAARGLALPSSATLDEAAIERVCRTLRRACDDLGVAA